MQRLFSRSLTCFILTLVFIFLYSGFPCRAAAKNTFATTPRLNNGQKWTIGYLQGGDYGSYQRSLAALVKGLMRLGWIETSPLPKPPNDKDTRQLWHWLANDMQSKYIRFPEDCWYSADWDKDKRAALKKRLINRLNADKNTIDLMLAMGTWAGQDLATNDHHVPTVVGSTTDPIASGIIKSADNSGCDHIIAKVDPERHKRQVTLFHKIFRFKKLGIVYEDSPEGRGFSGVNSVYEVASRLHFNVEKCEARFNGIERKQAEKNVVDCYKALAPKVDAVYLVRHPGVNLTNLPDILAPLIARKIPTFAQGLSDEVAHGVLLSISLADFSYIGDFYAKTIAKIFNGAKPCQLPQRFQNPPKIAINLKTAQLIGYDPSVDIVGAADEIFTDIAVAAPK